MEIKLAVLADAANLSIEGKLNILGAFSNILTTAVPARHPAMQLVLGMDASIAEAGMEKQLEVKLLTADGESVASVTAKFNLPATARAGSRIELGMILPLRDVVFPKEGDYVFVVLIDNRTEREIPLSVTIQREGDMTNAG